MRDYHVHTHFCDGKSSPREVVESALAKGMTVLGFSGHGYTDLDETYCMSREGQARYIREVRELAEEYRDRMQILCGVEKDTISRDSSDPFDYVIGSVHYFRFGDELADVDHTPETLLAAAEKYCDGDAYALAEQYYDRVSHVVEITDCDIIGHFDLITKFTEKADILDVNHPRYRAAWKKAADELLKTGRVFEVNMGAISRGWRTSPYPSEEILLYLKDHGAKFVLNSDSHHRDTLCYQFDIWEPKFRAMGIHFEEDPLG